MRIRVFIIGVLVLLALVTWMAFKSANQIGVEVPRSKIPPPLVARMARTNAAVRIFPGFGGAFIVLPDGSLWSWGLRTKGLSSQPKTPPPTQIGTNCDWVEAFAANHHCVGLRADGSIWEWGRLAGGQFATVPTQVGSGKEWAGIAAGDIHTVALKRDGTLWSWGDNSMLQLGNGSGPSQSTPVQVGTNRNWKAVTCGQGTYTLALQTDGTLWVWGTTPGPLNGNPGVKLSTPTQLCRESDWIGFAPGPGAGVLTRSALWIPFEAPPDPKAERGSVCHLVSSNSEPQNVALASCGRPEVYRVTSDGRLWRKPFPIGPWAGERSKDWRQVGNRTDWSFVCGSGTALGCTTEGTLWMWGFDSSQEPIPDMRSRCRLLIARVRTWVGLGRGSVSTLATPPYQREPRPVLTWTIDAPEKQ